MPWKQKGFCGWNLDANHNAVPFHRQSYSREIPSRFVKDVLKFTDENNDGTMEYSEFKQFLENIGAGDQMNKEEIHDVFQYMGAENASDGEISVEKMQKVLIDDLRERMKK